jgi:hypothetical protein
MKVEIAFRVQDAARMEGSIILETIWQMGRTVRVAGFWNCLTPCPRFGEFPIDFGSNI